MDTLEPRRVPGDTTEITYTGRGGRQVSVPLERKGRQVVARPGTHADVAALDALGFTTVGRRADTDENAPVTGEKED